MFIRTLRSDQAEELSLLITWALALGIEGTLGAIFETTDRATNPSYANSSWTVFGYELDPAEKWIDRVLDSLGPDVYITIDVDYFDPAFVPATHRSICEQFALAIRERGHGTAFFKPCHGWLPPHANASTMSPNTRPRCPRSVQTYARP